MKKFLLPMLLLSPILFGCNNNNSSSTSIIDSSSEIVSSSSSSESSKSQEQRGIPEFSKSEYSYDKNALEDLELPVTLNGVNIFAAYIDGYKLSAKEMSYDIEHKVMIISEDFMATLDKGDYQLVVYFDDEVDPITLKITVINSVTTSFDITTKKYAFGKTGDLKYDCDFSTANVRKLMKGDVEIPANLYSFSNNIFTLESELLDRCYGSSKFALHLTNHDVYEFIVETDIIFFTDYDITTIHNTVESIYGANPLYQYASSEHLGIVDATEQGMSGKALKYIPNTVPVELDCNAIMTLADTTTSMSWYKLGYTKAKNYLITFDYMTVGSSNVSGQQFKFATTTTWGAPFTYSKDLLMGPENDNTLHHFSVVLSGNDIQAGTFIYAKWLNGSGYLLLDNFRVTEITNPFAVKPISNHTAGSGSLTGTVTSNGWGYSINVDGISVNAIINGNNFEIPATFMNNLEAGEHTITYVTSIGNYEVNFNVVSTGTANLTETSKSFSSTDADIQLAGSFNNVTVTGAKVYGQNQYDVSHTNGVAIAKTNFAVSSTALTIKKEVLTNLYGTTSLKVMFSNGDSKTISLTNTKVVFKTNFNEANVWCYDFMGGLNMSICQDTAMTSMATVDNRQVLVYEPKNAVLGHSSTPGTFQNGVLTFKRNCPQVAGTSWESLDLDATKQYKFTLEYDIEGDNENTDLIFYRWMTDGSEDKTSIVDPASHTYSKTFVAGDFVGCYFYCAYKNASDVTDYKVIIKSFTVEAI